MGGEILNYGGVLATIGGLLEDTPGCFHHKGRGAPSGEGENQLWGKKGGYILKPGRRGVKTTGNSILQRVTQSSYL